MTTQSHGRDNVLKQGGALRGAVQALGSQLRRLGRPAAELVPDPDPRNAPAEVPANPSWPANRPSTRQRVAIRAHREDWP